MQRALVILSVLVLVAAALAVGTLASNWPFWRRAWLWQAAADGWPESLPGPTQQLRPAAAAWPLQFTADQQLAQVAGQASTYILLRATTDGDGGAWFAPGYQANSMVDGRGLATGLLAPLYGLLEAQHPGLLDAPVSMHITSWSGQRRGAITPRQLLLQLSGLPAGELRPLNPASTRAQLASGPDFDRAALHWRMTYPPGSHFEMSPVNAQLLAVLAARLTGTSYAQLLEARLWSRLAANPAVATLDHVRGHIAAHCCLRAAASDWLRLGLLLANDGKTNERQLLPAGFAAELGRDSPVHAGYGLGYRLAGAPGASRMLILETAGRQLLVAPGQRLAVLWIGNGPPPAQLEQLVTAALGAADSPATE